MASMVTNQVARLESKLNALREQAICKDQQEDSHAYQLLGRRDERFNCLSDLFVDYANELLSDLQRIKQLEEKTQDIDLLQLFYDRLCGKFMMLQEVIHYNPPTKRSSAAKVQAWQSQLKKAAKSGNVDQLYAKLTQQKEFEQRLVEQIEQQVEHLQRVNDVKQSAQLQQQILDLKQRYGRCQRTTWQLEQLIQQKQSRY